MERFLLIKTNKKVVKYARYLLLIIVILYTVRYDQWMRRRSTVCIQLFACQDVLIRWSLEFDPLSLRFCRFFFLHGLWNYNWVLNVHQYTHGILGHALIAIYILKYCEFLVRTTTTFVLYCSYWIDRTRVILLTSDNIALFKTCGTTRE